MQQQTGDTALRMLEPLIGEWTLEAKPPGDAPWTGGGGTCRFDWHRSGAHVVQRTTIAVPEAPDSVSIIGCDAANETYFQLYSDDRGVCRVYEMSIDGHEWKLWRNGDPFAQRFVATIGDGGDVIAGRWEIAENGTDFTLDFELTYRRVKDGTGTDAHTS